MFTTPTIQIPEGRRRPTGHLADPARVAHLSGFGQRDPLSRPDFTALPAQVRRAAADTDKVHEHTPGDARSRIAARCRNEAGQVLILFALALPVLLGLSAVVIDLGNLYVQKRTFQTSADAAAIAAAQDLANGDTASATGAACTATCVSVLAGKYTGANGGASSTAALVSCASSTTANCYTWPYNSDSTRVEVRVRKAVSTLFARIFGVTSVNVTARAVAKISPGMAPPYSFVALNASNANHTLLIKLGGQLTINNALYVNSSHTDNGSPPGLGDAFDIKGGGNISAPAIRVVGGWENDTGSTVTVGGQVCSPTYPPGDSYSPKQYLSAAMTATQTTLKPTGTAIQLGNVVEIQNEKMFVTPSATVSLSITSAALTGGVATLTSSTSAGLAAGDTVMISGVGARYNGTFTVSAATATTFSYTPTPPAAVTVTNKAVTGGKAVLTSAGHGMNVGGFVVVALNPADARFDGTFTITAVTANTFSYALPAARTNAPTKSWSVANPFATLTATTTHPFVVNDTITVSGFTGTETVFNGQRTITVVPTTATFKFATAHADGGANKNASSTLTTMPSTSTSGAATPGNVASANVSPAGTGSASVSFSPSRVTLTRAYWSTAAATHTVNTEIKYSLLTSAEGASGNGCPLYGQAVLYDPFASVLSPVAGDSSLGAGPSSGTCPSSSSLGTAPVPKTCGISSQTVTLQPGTYYGGICIGAMSGTACNTGCTAGTAHVTMAPGTYVIAGGGFFVCGSSTLSAPNVLIYNSWDSSQPTGSGVIDQVMLNTTGSVLLGPQSSGTWKGLTVFQDRSQKVQKDSHNTTCDKKDKDVAEWDIALLNMATTGANGALGSISGTVYAANELAVFGDRVSGTANLAVLTGCIYIEGATSTFNFESSGLFGVGSALSE